MFQSSTNYDFVDKEVVEKVFPYMRDILFGHWHHPPIVEIRPYDEDEFSLWLTYENTSVNKGEECSHGHEALDLVKAFLDGIILYNTLISPDPKIRERLKTLTSTCNTH